MKHFPTTVLPIITLSSVLLIGCNQQHNSEESLNDILPEPIITVHDVSPSQPLVEELVEVDRLQKVEKREVSKAREKLAYKSTPQLQVAKKRQIQEGVMLTNSAVQVYGHDSESEKYASTSHNQIQSVSVEPVSTFSIDVDTASYSNVRRFLMNGHMPNVDAVRLEEMINYFNYDYAQAKDGEAFSLTIEMGPAPWNVNKKLLHIGIQGKSIKAAQRPNSNLVFLIDVSGSMHAANKLGLLKPAMKMLTRQMGNEDTISIVVYAGNSGTHLSPTSGANKQKIMQSIEALSAGGSTHGSAGIQAAYALAEQHFIKGGINRVMLATDGDFNVGTTDERSLKQLIENKRKSGISLSILGFGHGNYNDKLMQTLAQNGNGNAYYIDSLNEARKVLVEDLSATLMTIAKDVKIQIEFNPNVVSEYRLIGYETRHLNRQDFNNDKVDAGEIGAGHTVTALYELTLVNSPAKMVDDLRYQTEKSIAKPSHHSEEIAFLRLRHKQPNGDKSQLQETVIKAAAMQSELDATSDNYRFSAAVAAFGQLLRHDQSLSTMSWQQLITLAQSAKGADPFAYRGEFIQLVRLAETLQPQLAQK